MVGAELKLKRLIWPELHIALTVACKLGKKLKFANECLDKLNRLITAK